MSPTELWDTAADFILKLWANKMAWKMCEFHLENNDEFCVQNDGFCRCEFHLDSSGQLQWVQFGNSPGGNRSGAGVQRLELESDGMPALYIHAGD